MGGGVGGLMVVGLLGCGMGGGEEGSSRSAARVDAAASTRANGRAIRNGTQQTRRKGEIGSNNKNLHRARIQIYVD